MHGVAAVCVGTGPARLLDMVEGRTKQAFKAWLAERPDAWRGAVEVVAMTVHGFKTAAVEELPDAVAQAHDDVPGMQISGRRGRA